MLRKIFLGFFLFLMIGEIFVRIDKEFQFLGNNKVVKIATNLEITPEYNSLNNNSINLTDKSFRVLVIGDSYIHGGGISFSDNFSQQMKLKLIQGNSYFTDILVLDVSVPSSNTLDNYISYFQYVDKFKPDVVIIGYNYNDVLGDLDKSNTKVSIGKSISSNTNSNRVKTTTRKIYDIIFKSKLLEYVLSNSNTQLKAHGIIVPHTEFDNVLTSYIKNKENWQKSKLLLQEIINDSKSKNIDLVVLKFPEMNLLKYTSIFKQVDDTISNFFNYTNTIHYINGGDIFAGENSEKYILSKYDGHPNEQAHSKIATYVFEQIKTYPCAHNGFNKSRVQ